MKLARLTDVRFHNALRRLAAAPVPLRVAFKLKGIQARVDEELKKFEECRLLALDKYGKKGEDGKVLTKVDGTVEFEPDQLKLFAAEFNDLGHAEVDVGFVKVEELGDRVELSADELSLLDSVLVE